MMPRSSWKALPGSGSCRVSGAKSALHGYASRRLRPGLPPTRSCASRRGVSATAASLAQGGTQSVYAQGHTVRMGFVYSYIGARRSNIGVHRGYAWVHRAMLGCAGVNVIRRSESHRRRQGCVGVQA